MIGRYPFVSRTVWILDGYASFFFRFHLDLVILNRNCLENAKHAPVSRKKNAIRKLPMCEQKPTTNPKRAKF
jgi:hypothetical protein